MIELNRLNAEEQPTAQELSGSDAEVQKWISFDRVQARTLHLEGSGSMSSSMVLRAI